MVFATDRMADVSHDFASVLGGFRPMDMATAGGDLFLIFFQIDIQMLEAMGFDIASQIAQIFKLRQGVNGNP